MTYLDCQTQCCLSKVSCQAWIAPMTYSSLNNTCKNGNMEFKTWTYLAPKVLAEAAVVATGAPTGVKMCFYGHSRGKFFFWCHSLGFDNWGTQQSSSRFSVSAPSFRNIDTAPYAVVRRWPALSVNQPARRRWMTGISRKATCSHSHRDCVLELTLGLDHCSS